jgi:hypothetical protein
MPGDAGAGLRPGLIEFFNKSFGLKVSNKRRLVQKSGKLFSRKVVTHLIFRS